MGVIWVKETMLTYSQWVCLAPLAPAVPNTMHISAASFTATPANQGCLSLNAVLVLVGAMKEAPLHFISTVGEFLLEIVQICRRQGMGAIKVHFACPGGYLSVLFSTKPPKKDT